MQVRVLNFTAEILFLTMMEEMQKEERATIMALLFHNIHSDRDTSFRCVTCFDLHSSSSSSSSLFSAQTTACSVLDQLNYHMNTDKYALKQNCNKMSIKPINVSFHVIV